MKIGFTGTRKGMTPAQRAHLILVLDKLKPETVHHGGCYGADEQFDYIVSQSFPDVKRVCPLAIQSGCTSIPAKPPLERNHDIVDASDLLIAAPKSPEEELRSGTWATIRYARKQGKEIIFL